MVRCRAGQPVAARVGPGWEGAPPVAVWGKDEEPDEPPDGNVCVFDAAIERMEKAAGVTLDDTRQEELVRALGSYLTQFLSYRDALRPGTLRARLRRIEKKARALAADLDDHSATGATVVTLIDSLLPERASSWARIRPLGACPLHEAPSAMNREQRAAIAALVRGQHYTAWVETVKDLKREGRLLEAEALLIECDRAAAAEAEVTESEKAPWYENQLGVVRRKMERASKKIGSKG